MRSYITRFTSWSQRHPNWTAAGVLVLILLVFFSRAILTDGIPSAADYLQVWAPFSIGVPHQPENGLFHDIALIFDPFAHYLQESVARGEFPLWNPYQGFGTVHLANGQSALFFPLTWAVVLLGTKWGLLVLSAGKLFLIGFFTFLFLRELKLHRLAALVGGVAFMFAGFNVDWLYWPLPSVTASLPLLLLGVHRAFSNPRRASGYVAATLAVALGLVGGHPETTAHVYYIGAMYAVFMLAFSRTPLRGRLVAFGKLTLAGLGGLALSAVQLLPLLSYLLNSAALASVGRDAQVIVPREYFVLNILPDLFGNQAFPQTLRGFFGGIGVNYNEVTGGAVGVTIALLAVLAVAYGIRRSRSVGFFAFLALFGAGVVYRVPIIYDFFTAAPFLKHGLNQRFSFSIAFAACVLAAVLLSRVLAGEVQLWKSKTFLVTSLFAGAVTILAAVGLSTIDKLGDHTGYLLSYVPLMALNFAVLCVVLYAARGRALALWLFGLILVELGLHGMTYEPLTQPRFYYPTTPTISFLKENIGDQRFVSLGNAGFFPPNVATYYQLHDIRYYDGALLKDYTDALNAHASAPGNWMIVVTAEPPFLSASGVKYVMANSERELTDILKLTPANRSQFKVAFTNPSFTLYENENVWPRAFTVGEPSALMQLAEAGTVPPAASVVRETSNSLALSVDVEEDTYLVTSDTYTPDWTVTVDGEAADVVRAELNFRSVRVPAGEHEVVFRYKPRSFYVGAAVSLATAAGLALWGVRRWVRRRALARTGATPG